MNNKELNPTLELQFSRKIFSTPVARAKGSFSSSATPIKKKSEAGALGCHLELK